MLALQTPAGVVFDMDGTLTVPCIDFVAMRTRVFAIAGVSSGDVLEIIASLDGDKHAAAVAVIEQVEVDALARLELMPGCLDLLRLLDSQQIPRALVTRNTQRGIDALHDTLALHNVAPFSPAFHRDQTIDGQPLPPKPDPAALLRICDAWSIPPAQVRKMMNFALKTRNYVSKTRNFVLIVMNFAARQREAHACEWAMGALSVQQG